jgi:hypothetical protein
MHTVVMMMNRQKCITAEPLVPDPSPFEIEITIEKLKKNHKVLIKFWQK